MKLRRQREAEWAEIISRQQSSGLSISRYCREQGIRESRFYWWRKRLEGSRDKIETATVGAQDIGTKPIQFLPVKIKDTIVDTTARSMDCGSRADIFLPNGTVLRFSGDVPEDKLSQIIRIVNGASC